MNRNEYMAHLRNILRNTDEEEKEELLESIEDHFDNGLREGKSEQEIIEELGPCEQFENEMSHTQRLSHLFERFLSGWQVPRLEEKAFPYAENFDSIFVCGGSGDVDIVKADSFRYASRKPEEVSFRLHERGLWIQLSATDVTLLLPDLSTLTLEKEKGDITITNLVLDKLLVRGGTGDIEIDNIQTDQADIQTKIGDIEIENIQADVVSLQTNVGDISLQDASVQHLQLATSLGDIELQHLAGETLEASSQTGDIDASFISHSTQNLTTKHGDIDYAVQEDQTIHYHLFTGDFTNDTPLKSSGDKQVGVGLKQVSLSTSSGDIELHQ